MSCNHIQYKIEKMDNALIQEINSLDKDKSDKLISIIGKTILEINDNIKEEIASSGVVIETVAGNIFTATGDRCGISKLSRQDFIEKLELSVVRPLIIK
ncbi:MAG TPA: hypothetical protein PLT92_03580 [Ignavibacteriaceae bacterium]|nr:hypothetical protein [Ignavibacteriaceae bacterium]